MSEKDNQEKNLEEKEPKEQETAQEAAATEEESKEPEVSEVEKLAKDLEDAKAELEKQKKEYLFLLAEFDNFRKRTLKEKSDLVKNAAEKAMLDILPVVDDFERALQAMHDSSDLESVKEGVDLIYNKFVKYLENNGVKAIDSNNADFNTEFHEAVTTFPASDESQKGKVIDTVQKGYMINDKVLRHSKVVVGQ
ncbi:MAG TPA: nucleotide exchange factor GrpE [Candidatus Limisoma gallistercoris]|nr:nucleotide exchange factor GrpE [Candidatus Limisoma gallistercoris]